MSETMKAWFVVPGPEGGLLELREIPRPTAGENEVLVRIEASAINRGELINRPLLRLDNPRIRPTRGGSEFAGEIVALGPGVTRWKVGDRVMGRAVGSYAEYNNVPERALMPVPDGMSSVEAAAIPNVYVTAHDAMVTNGQLKRGESIMITAGSSGVGTAALQIARLLGAAPIIATTRSPAKSEALRGLGADEVIDTRQSGWTKAVMAATGNRGIDVLIDHVGGPMLADNLHVMAIKGRFVSVGRNAGKVGECDLDEVARKRVSIIGVTFRTRTPEETLVCSERFAADMMRDVFRGALKPVVDRTFPYEQIAAAQEYMLSDAQIGKIVLTFGGSR
jgi:NADPH2:quinone reductase